jgi:hypothetical protein
VIRRKSLAPSSRRNVAGDWGELDYLCKKVHYWLYARKQKSGATRYRDRLARVLRDLPRNNLAILRHDGLALLYELKADLGKAIAHRKREIALMEGLLREAKLPRYSDSTRDYMLQDRQPSDLRQRRTILEALEQAKSQFNGHAPRAASAAHPRQNSLSD